ncbi:MAG: hypothetical protein D3909_05125 [Candidatus Electrothrix sp. ATG1]|nr:hypothetical protein [Candidatus Electrothrix sp. ATG1]
MIQSSFFDNVFLTTFFDNKRQGSFFEIISAPFYIELPPLPSGAGQQKMKVYRVTPGNYPALSYKSPSLPSGKGQQNMKAGQATPRSHLYFHINTHLTPLWGVRQQKMKVDWVTPRSYPALSYKRPSLPSGEGQQTMKVYRGDWSASPTTFI